MALPPLTSFAPFQASSGFCTAYCGWHKWATVSGKSIKYGFVGNPATKCAPSCSAAANQGQTATPNGNLGADAMASVIAHELAETVTDPEGDGWYEGDHSHENGDLCAWTFGTTYTVNGGLANVRLGSHDYLLQRNHVNAAGGYCSLSYGSAPSNNNFAR